MTRLTGLRSIFNEYFTTALMFILVSWSVTMLVLCTFYFILACFDLNPLIINFILFDSECVYLVLCVHYQ